MSCRRRRVEEHSLFGMPTADIWSPKIVLDDSANSPRPRRRASTGETVAVQRRASRSDPRQAAQSVPGFEALRSVKVCEPAPPGGLRHVWGLVDRGSVRPSRAQSRGPIGEPAKWNRAGGSPKSAVSAVAGRNGEQIPSQPMRLVRRPSGIHEIFVTLRKFSQPVASYARFASPAPSGRPVRG